jgi:F420-non-reducing hydrogenase large subunit
LLIILLLPSLDAAFHVEFVVAVQFVLTFAFAEAFDAAQPLDAAFLGDPLFVVGPDAPPEKRNILGVIEKVGLDIAKEVIKHRAFGQEITAILGGKATHPVFGLPGGISKPITEEERAVFEEKAKSKEETSSYGSS